MNGKLIVIRIICSFMSVLDRLIWQPDSGFLLKSYPINSLHIDLNPSLVSELIQLSFCLCSPTLHKDHRTTELFLCYMDFERSASQNVISFLRMTSSLHASVTFVEISDTTKTQKTMLHKTIIHVISFLVHSPRLNLFNENYI